MEMISILFYCIVPVTQYCCCVNHQYTERTLGDLVKTGIIVCKDKS